MSSITTASEAEAQPISLYIDLFPDTNADLEVVAEASLAFVRALRAAAHELSPENQVRVELVSGTEGSLSLNSVVKFAHGKLGIDKTKVRALALVAVGWFLNQTGQWVFGKGADAALEMVTGSKENSPSAIGSLSEEEIHRVAEEIARIHHSPEVQRNVGQIYRNLDKDVSIRGVGIRIDDLRIPPSIIVPRAEFSSRAVDAREIQAVESHRSRQLTETVKLVTAVLDPKSRRKWVIETSEGTRSAVMSDKAFIALLESGQITTRLSANMKFEADLSFSETKMDGRWKITGVSIDRVRRIIVPNSAESLAPSGGGKEG